MNRILCGDAREQLKQLPDGSAQCVVTSPPYFGLRDYKCDGQIGLEPTPEEYVEKLVGVFREVRRVLRDDGVCFLNLGDSYAGSGPSGASYQSKTTLDRVGKLTDGSFRISKSLEQRGLTYAEKKPIPPPGLKPKDLMMIPARVALALQSDGWWLRSEITWCKKSCLPESVTDRPTNATEKVFLLTKSAKYFYDAEAVKEEATSGPAGTVNKDQPRKMNSTPLYQSNRGGRTQEPVKQGAMGIPENGKRNLRNFWLLGPDPFPGSHFATMPRKLVEPCILAGTSEAGCCSECGKPWARVVERDKKPQGRSGTDVYTGQAYQTPQSAVWGSKRNLGGDAQSRTIGWQPACTCNAPAIPCTVLDPFGGSGTTAQVAQQLGRHWIMIELNSEYIPLIEQRTQQNSLGFL